VIRRLAILVLAAGLGVGSIAAALGAVDPSSGSEGIRVVPPQRGTFARTPKSKRARVVVTVVNGDTHRRVRGAVVRIGDKRARTNAKGVTSPLLDYGTNRTSPVGIIYYTGSRYPALRGRFLMCENHGRGMLALRINRTNPGKLLNLTPVVPQCTIDLVQTRDGWVAFSDSQAIYRLVRG